MTFEESIKSAFSKYATFSGRARRSEYWYFVLAFSVLSTLFTVLDSAVDSSVFTWLNSVLSLAVFLPNLALCWRRMHDIGKSGAWSLIVLIPFVGCIIYLVWACRDSQPGENQYGPNPKGVE